MARHWVVIAMKTLSSPTRFGMFAAALLGAVVLLLSGCATSPESRPTVVSKWERFERSFQSLIPYVHPLQEVTFTVTFTSPTGERQTVDGFWDGGLTWKVRFKPGVVGRWTYRTECSKDFDLGLHDLKGSFVCTAARRLTPFTTHGPIQVSRDRRHLAHQDGTPFFWLADTAWNGPLQSTTEDWIYYLDERVRQRFSAVQWVTTQWRAAPKGDRDGQLAYTGLDIIEVNPAFFQRLDQKVDQMNRAGLLSVPVMLWAIQGGSNPEINPGVSLPEDQAILLARYLLARWGANDVVWILAGDGDYRGAKADKWKRIGRAVFLDRPHAPATLHPGGRMWVWDDFRDESWIGITGYQSGHSEGADNLKWIHSGPPATEWRKDPVRPFISLEAPYENHRGAQQQRISTLGVRRAHYWSLLNAPTAGVTYGGHGVWGWDNGSEPPVDHPGSGVPLPWPQALRMPGAEQMAHLARLFTSFDFTRLRPAPELVAVQPGAANPAQFVAAARTEDGELALVYTPEARTVSLAAALLPPNVVPTWFDPRSGSSENGPVIGVVNGTAVEFTTPAPGDWVLVLKGGRK